jgi:hypothetical protein
MSKPNTLNVNVRKVILETDQKVRFENSYFAFPFKRIV